MTVKRIALVFIGMIGAVALFFIAVGGRGSAAPPVPSDWMTINAGGAFTFKAPPTLKAVPAQGIDSFVGRYASRTLDVRFDYGAYSDPMEGEDSSPNRCRWTGGTRGCFGVTMWWRSTFRT